MHALFPRACGPSRRFARLAVLLLGLLLTLPVLAAPPVPLLWKVSDADNSVYLLGSFHMLRPGDEVLAAEVEDAFAAADALVFELAPDEATSPTLAAAMLRAALRKRPGTLQDDLGPALWARMQAHAAATGLPLAQLSGVEPWFLGLTLAIGQLQRMGFDSALGLDRQLMQAAASAGKPASGLERAADQIAVLAGMPLATQVQMLDQSLAQAEAGDEAIETMYRTWRRGDAEGLWRLLGEDLRRQYPELYRHINVARNEAWLPQIRQRLERGQGDVLVVVGALHLLGSDGLVERLRAQGYRVERVCRACAGR